MLRDLYKKALLRKKESSKSLNTYYTNLNTL